MPWRVTWRLSLQVINWISLPLLYVVGKFEAFCPSSLLQQLSRQEELRQEKQRQMEDYVKEKLNETANKNAGTLIRDFATLN